MKLSSGAFAHLQVIARTHTCDGGDSHPPLSISDVPEETKSLVLIVDDPDAPNGVWLHWLLWNIDPKTTTIQESSIPEGAVEGMTDFGRVGYGGPCPPSGTHRYFFRLFALDTALSLARGASRTELERAMEGHIVDSAELIGLYARS